MDNNAHQRSVTGATVVGSSPPESPSAVSDPTRIESSSIGENVIPSKHPYRTLVLCFDGTGDQFDSDNSNIVELFTMLKKDDRNKQMVYYQAGIGTYTTPQVATPFMAKISKVNLQELC